MSESKLNGSGRFAGVFVTSKLTPIIIGAIVVFGIFALLMTPREENPQIVVPAADVTVMLPGASAEEIEALVLTPLEQVLSEMPGVDHTYGVALNSFARVTVQFEVGEDKERSLLKLYDHVLREQHRLPDGATPPNVRALDIDDVPIVVVTLSSAVYDDYALKRVADRVAERLQSLKSVSLVSVFGGRDREVRIELDPTRLQAYGVTANRVRQAIALGNVAVPIGTVAESNTLHTVFFSSHIDSASALRTLVVHQADGRPVYLDDIADIVDGPPIERGTVSRFAYGPADPLYSTHKGQEMAAVSIAVAKKTGTNAVGVERDVLARIERMRSTLIPAEVHVVTTRADGTKANKAVNVLIGHLGISVTSVFLILLVSLGWREAVIVTLVVPLVFALTLGGSWFAGITINRVTLFALILSLGLLVDAAIVVVENIYRHYRLCGTGDRRKTALEAVAEIANPTNLATLSVMLVFGSLVSITGMPGQYFEPIAFNVTFAMAASLLVAYVVVPWAANVLPEKKGVGHNEDGGSAGNSFLHRGYRALISRLLRRSGSRRLAWLILFVLVGGAMTQPVWQFIRPAGVSGPLSPLGIGMGMMPKDDKNTFKIEIEMPETTLVEETDQLARLVGNVVGDNRYVSNYQTWVGHKDVPDFSGLLRGAVDAKQPNIADIRVNLLDKESRGPTSGDIVRGLRSQIGPLIVAFPGAVVRFIEDPPGPPVRATLFVELYGQDRQELRKLAHEVVAEFAATYDVVDVFDTEPVDIPRYEIVVDKEKAALSGVAAAQVTEILRVLFDGEIIGRVHTANETNIVPIRLYVPRRYELNLAELYQVYVDNVAGRRVPVSELVRVEKKHEDLIRLHKDNERVTFVGAELGRTAPIYAVIDLTKRMSRLAAGDNKGLRVGNLGLNAERPDTTQGPLVLWEGEMRMTLDTYRDMTAALILALTVTFLLLVTYYQSFKIPLVAMAAVPFGIVGIFPGHWIMGATFSATSMIGIIALAGVVVRNSLLIIDFVRDNLRAGMSPHDALCEAGAVRLKPILLTTTAIIFGSAVIISDPVFGGLAIALIFGSLASTVLTLIFIPLLFAPVARKQAAEQLVQPMHIESAA